MSEAVHTTLTLMEQARDAARRGEWPRAYDLLAAADAGTAAKKRGAGRSPGRPRPPGGEP